MFDNPWSRNTPVTNSGVEDPIIFIDFDRACQFIENQEGIVLDARNPDDYGLRIHPDKPGIAAAKILRVEMPFYRAICR